MLFSYLVYFCLYFLICQMGRLSKKAMPIPPPHGILDLSHHVMPRNAFSEAHWKCLSFKKILQMWNWYVNLFPELHSEWFKWESFPLHWIQSPWLRMSSCVPLPTFHGILRCAWQELKLPLSVTHPDVPGCQRVFLQFYFLTQILFERPATLAMLCMHI